MTEADDHLPATLPIVSSCILTIVTCPLASKSQKPTAPEPVARHASNLLEYNLLGWNPKRLFVAIDQIWILERATGIDLKKRTARAPPDP